MTNNYIAIPEWLRGTPEYHIFCTHRNKVPTHNTHVDDMSTYHTFTEALALMNKDEGLGIGMFGNLCGVDIDHCVNNHVISPEAQAIIDYFDGAYIEYSMSGTGVHILFFCKDQHKYQKYYTKMNKKHLEDKGINGIEGLEFYQGQVDNRYLTLTGNIIPSKHPHGYTVSKDKIQKFLDKYFQKPPVTTTTPPPLSNSDSEDVAWFNFARQRKPEKLMALASKKPTGSGGTESEDDLAFMSEIAFWTNNNPTLMRSVFESSFYYSKKDLKHKKKWARPDYSNGVIEKAFQQNTARLFFTDYYYDGTSIVKGGESTMVAPSISTRISKAGQELVVIDTKQFKFEASKPELKKNSEERTVRWVSVYKKGSNEPSRFLDRNTPEFELAAGIVLEKF